MRPETGPMQFGDDWPGVFIRGDNAAAHAMLLRRVIDGEQVHPLEVAHLRSLLRALQHSNVLDPMAKAKLRPYAECAASEPDPRDTDLATLRAQLAAVTAERDEASEQKSTAYRERNQCVAFLTKLAYEAGYHVSMGMHPDDPAWDPDWRNIVFLEGPTGQLSWHIHDSEVSMFAWIWSNTGKWDGHSTEEKYARMAAHMPTHVVSLLRRDLDEMTGKVTIGTRQLAHARSEADTARASLARVEGELREAMAMLAKVVSVVSYTPVSHADCERVVAIQKEARALVAKGGE